MVPADLTSRRPRGAVRSLILKNIILIGMPSAGKSTVGVLLAKKCVMNFLDTDLLLQEEGGASLETLIDREGEAAFLAREGALLSRLTAENTVIATGGSAVYSEEGMRHLRDIGTVLYLKVSEAEVTARVGDLHRRGVVLHGCPDLAALYRERTRLYERWADATADLTGLDAAGALRAMLAALGA